ncbi:MAG: DUF1574 family protein, partial [Spirochaetales bacterium]|nr:DUF1574 family protein [Spirochaetales bacterium]
ELLEELKKIYDTEKNKPELRGATTDVAAYRKKIAVILGSSRLLYFDHQAFSRDYPEWELFNFSAPVTAPAYYAYILERIQERGIQVDLVLMEADAFQYNDASSAFERSNLAYTFDLRFVLQYFPYFRRDEVSGYLARWLFAAYKYPPRLDQIYDRLSDPLNRFNIALKELDRHQRENRGAGRSIIPRENWYELDYAMLQGTALRTIAWLYRPYLLSDRQFFFTEKALALSRAAGTTVLLLRPPVSRPMQVAMEQDSVLSKSYREWEERLHRLRGDIPFLDLQNHPEFYCNTFVDASHMSLDCYHALLPVLMKAYLDFHVTR